MSGSARWRGGRRLRRWEGAVVVMLRGEGTRMLGGERVVVPESRGSSALTRSTGSDGSWGSGKRSGMDRVPSVAPGR